MSTQEAIEHVSNFRRRVLDEHGRRYRKFVIACARERFSPRPVTSEDAQQVAQATVREGTRQRAVYPAEVWRL